MTTKASSLPGYPVRLLRQRMARRAANLLDPRFADKTLYPAFVPGMSTAKYIEHFQWANLHSARDNQPAGVPWIQPLQFTCRPGPAPMLDPLFVETVEEVAL